MNEQHLFRRPEFPWLGLLLGLCGGLLLSFGVVRGQDEFLLGAVPLLGVAVCLLVYRGGRFEAELTENGLRGVEPNVEIPYESIESLTLAGRPQRPRPGNLQKGAVMVMHTQGVLEVPSDLNTPVVELYRGLLERISGSGSRDVAAPLRDFLQEQEDAFGEEMVGTFNARRHLGSKPSRRRAIACFIAMLLSGCVWVGSPAFLPAGGGQTAFLPFGTMLIVIGLLGWLILHFSRRYPTVPVPHWRRSSLIVSPGGIAMVQGDVQGQLRWDELQNVQYKSNQAAVALAVSAATIQVSDVYDRPLPLIHSAIMRYWRPDSA